MLSNDPASSAVVTPAPQQQDRVRGKEPSLPSETSVVPAGADEVAVSAAPVSAAFTRPDAAAMLRRDPAATAPVPASEGSKARPEDSAAVRDPARGTFPETWRQDLAAGDKSFLKTLERFDSPAALAKAYREFTTKLSSGELKAMKPVPENATPEEVAAWKVDRGLPESAEAYISGLKLSDGTLAGESDRPLLASFAERALDANFTGEQYNRAVGWYFALQDRMLAERQQADGQFKAQSASDLMREWTGDYAMNRNMVAQFFDRTFPQQFKTEMLNARLPDGRMLANDPAFNRAILELAKFVNPSGALLPNNSGAGPSSVEARIAEIETKYMRAAHGSESWKSYWAGESGAACNRNTAACSARVNRFAASTAGRVCANGIMWDGMAPSTPHRRKRTRIGRISRECLAERRKCA